MEQANPIQLPLRSLCKIGRTARETGWSKDHIGGMRTFRKPRRSLAVRDVRNGKPHAVVMVPGILELNMTQRT